VLLISTIARHAPITLVTSYGCGWHAFKDSIAVAIGLLRSHPRTSISTFSLLSNRRPQKCCFAPQAAFQLVVWAVTGSPMEQLYCEVSYMLHGSACWFVCMKGTLLVEHPISVYRWVRLDVQKNSQDLSLLSVVIWYRFVSIFIFGSRSQWCSVACLHCSWNAVCACVRACSFCVLNILI